MFKRWRLRWYLNGMRKQLIRKYATYNSEENRHSSYSIIETVFVAIKKHYSFAYNRAIRINWLNRDDDIEEGRYSRDRDRIRAHKRNDFRAIDTFLADL